MRIDAQEKLKRLYDKGYRIIITSYDSPDPYILGIVKNDGQFYYHDSRMSGLPLSKVKESAVEVFKPVKDWQEVNLED
jgi:predicted glycosyltransferase involved in capsule biosynthesis